MTGSSAALPRKHLTRPKLDAEITKHFSSWTRQELIAHVLHYFNGEIDQFHEVDSHRTTVAFSRSQGGASAEAVASTTWVNFSHRSRLMLFIRCINLELQLARATVKPQPAPALATFLHSDQAVEIHRLRDVIVWLAGQLAPTYKPL